MGSDGVKLRGVHQPLKAARHDLDLVVDALEDDGSDIAVHKAFPGCDDLHILRTDDDVDRRVGAESFIHTGNPGAENLNDPVFHHDTVDDIAVPDKIGYERVDRLVVDHFRCADLLDVALVHDDDGVGHGEGFLLVVRNEDKGDAELVFQADQLILHFLAEL